MTLKPFWSLYSYNFDVDPDLNFFHHLMPHIRRQYGKFIHYLSSRKHNFSVIALSEMAYRGLRGEIFKLPAYNLVHYVREKDAEVEYLCLFLVTMNLKLGIISPWSQLGLRWNLFLSSSLVSLVERTLFIAHLTLLPKNIIKVCPALLTW